MEKIRQDTSPNALRGIEICESREIEQVPENASNAESNSIFDNC